MKHDLNFSRVSLLSGAEHSQGIRTLQIISRTKKGQAPAKARPPRAQEASFQRESKTHLSFLSVLEVSALGSGLERIPGPELCRGAQRQPYKEE